MHGYLYLALSTELYALKTAGAYPDCQENPGETVTYANSAGDVACRNSDSRFNLCHKDFHYKRTVDHALNKRLYKMLGYAIKQKD